MLLGAIEGLTEFLPVSSTGHLILVSSLLGLDPADPGLSAFLIVIQAGALVAVAGFFRKSVVSMLLGLAGRDAEGRRLAGLLALAFAPAAVAGLLFAETIKSRLFGPYIVAVALGIGGLAMILIERFRHSPSPEAEATAALSVAAISWRMALVIGLAQCLALWPGTSRSMVTILAGLLLGLSPRASAEFSFLLALPTLGAATLYDLYGQGPQILEVSGVVGLALGFAVSCVVAALAMKYFLRYLARHGLALFGYYRIAVAAVILFFWSPP